MNLLLICHLLVLLVANARAELGRRIFGGDSVEIRDVPYQVSLQIRDNCIFGHFCGGSLISNIFVLTAAHCQ